MISHEKNDEFEEKICKKIGQLTRVIFYLNVKNEEQDSLVRSMMSTYQKEINQVVEEANLAIEKKNQKSLLFDKIKDVETIAQKLEKNIQKENSDNMGLIRTLEKEVEEVNFFTSLENILGQQRSEMKEMENQLKNFHLILENKDELLDKKIKMKEEQFEMYIQENNRKYQK
jgi:hypothetical protein